MRPLLRAAALVAVGGASSAAAASSDPTIPPALHHVLPCGVQGRGGYVQGDVVAPTGPGYLLGWSGESDRLVCWDTNATDADGHCDVGDLLLNARPLTRFPPGGVLFLDGLCCTLPRCPASVSNPSDPDLAEAADDPDNVAIVYYTYDETARLDAVLGAPGAAGGAAGAKVHEGSGGGSHHAAAEHVHAATEEGMEHDGDHGLE